MCGLCFSPYLGVYMIPFSIMAAPLLLRAVSIWFDLVQSHNAQKDLTSVSEANFLLFIHLLICVFTISLLGFNVDFDHISG